MKKLSSYFILLLFIIILTGCAETNILDRVGITTLIGYDVGKEQKLSTTSVIREITPEFKSTVEVITTENETSKGNKMKTNRKLSKKITVGQMRVVLFGEELAKEDIHYNIDSLLENATVSNSIYMAVVEGETTPLLKYNYKNIDDLGQHIYRLIEQNIEQEFIISATLHEIAHDYYSVGTDIAIPTIKREEELIELSGIAIFKEGKMVRKLPAEDSFYVKLVKNNFKKGVFEIVIKKDDLPTDLQKKNINELPIAFDSLRSKKKLELVDPSTAEFDLHLQIKARITEISPEINVSDPEMVNKLEKAIAKKLSKEMSRVIAAGQEVDSDIFGFGDKYRSSVRNSHLTREKWDTMYKDMKVNVKVDFVILRNGVFD